MTAFVGNVFLEREEDGSPSVFTRICQIFSISGVGQTNELIDATTFCSGGEREYINGLADGEEITLEANYEPDSADLAAMITDVKNKAQRFFRLVVENGSPETTMTFNGICLGWTLNPAVDDRNTISFTVKISGDIVIA